MSDQDKLLLSADIYQFWMIDYAAREIVIVKQSGQAFREPLADIEDLTNSPIARVIFDWEKVWLTFHTTRADVVNWMGFNPETGGPRPRRPVVYLDQNKWSLVAAALVDPSLVSSDVERTAALKLIEWALDDGIVLPFSSAHLLETSPLFGDKRYEIGVAIARLSGGWQMRHPMDVFEQEAADAIGVHLDLQPADPGVQRPVITTEPEGWRATSDHGLGSPLDSSVDTFRRMLLAPTVAVSLLLDPQPTARGGVERWVDHHQRISAQIARQGGTKHSRRQLALRRFWNENLGLYRRGLIERHGVTEFPTLSNSALKTLFAGSPMVSLLSELFVQRFLDEQSKWQANDLVDMLFLSCAAGHCDFVVAENRTGTQLRQIQRSLRFAQTVFTSLDSLVSTLAAEGITTDAERRDAESDTLSAL